MLLVYGLIAIWLGLLFGSVLTAWRFQRGIGNRIELPHPPSVVVVTPVKGASRHLQEFLTRLRAQNYGPYRVLAVVESASDLALPTLRAASEGPGAPMSISIAGYSVDEGQKVHNLIHALDRLSDADEIVAFIDADTWPSSDWLLRAVEPLTRGNIDVVTGHRWLTPVRGDLPSALVAATNNSLVGAFRIFDVVWGGTCAMRRETIERIGLRDRWRGSIVDDVHLTRIIREHGLRLFVPRSLIISSPVEFSFRSSIAFARRQYKFVGWYLPRLWWTGTLITTLCSIAGICAFAAAIGGDRFAILAIVLASGLAQARAAVRLRIVRKALGADAEQAYRATADTAVRWLAPAWTAFHAAIAWSTLFSRRMAWSGIVYEFRGHRETKILSRATQ